MSTKHFASFILGVPSCQRTVAFEKSCILFNLAGVYTQIAAKQDRRSEKGLDTAVDSFLRAAGIFKHICETYTNAPSIDLKSDFLEVLVALMLAQARECLYEKLLLQIESFSINDTHHVSGYFAEFRAAEFHFYNIQKPKMKHI